MGGEGQVLVACRGVTKRFGGQLAVDDVDFEVRAGEVHALVGENDAGKSTLVKILDGYHRPDEGSVLAGGEEVRFASVRDAEAAGVAMIPQELDLFGELSVAEHLVVGRHRPRTSWRGIDWSAIRAAARERFEALGVELDVDAPVKQLSTANQQVVAIARALAGDARVVIMDEPTSSLSGGEVERLFGVMRDGEHVETKPASELDADELVRLMVGRSLEDGVDRQPGEENLQKGIDVTKSYLSANPDTAGAFGITTVALPGVAEAVRQMGLTGKVKVTGLTDPVIAKPYIDSGVVKKAVLWNAEDLGYLAVYVAKRLLDGDMPKSGSFKAARLGSVKLTAKDEVLLGKPLVYSKQDVGKYQF